MATYGREIQFDTIRVQRGNAEEITFRFKENGAAMNLTGKTVVFRAAVNGVVIRKSTEDDLAMPTPTNGEVTLSLSAAETRSIPPTKPMPFEVENFTDQITLGEGVLDGQGGTNDD